MSARDNKRRRTLYDLNHLSGYDSNSDVDDLPEQCTGGENSGMPVQDPSKDNNVDESFDLARRSELQLRNLQLSPSSRSFPGTDKLPLAEIVPIAEQETRNIPFPGAGRTLGSSSGSEPAQEEIVATPLPSEPAAPLVCLTVDRSQPSTSIQIWLSDGTRMIAQFNYQHTIAHIRSFIDASRPGGLKQYKLQAVGFPAKALNDNSQTIEQAGLLNSVVIQKF